MQTDSQQRGEAIVILAPGREDAWDPALAAIEAAGGRILLSFRPQAVVAVLDATTIGGLRQLPGIFLVETDAIAGDEAEAFPAQLGSIVMLWNERLARRTGMAPRAGEGLAWDAPGHLPPDPPPEIRDWLRRRESGEE